MTKQGNREGTSMPEPLSTKLNRLSETARAHPGYQYRTLAHLINEEMLQNAYQALRKDAAAGIDRITAEAYGNNLQGNLKDLHHRLRERRYRAQPLRRVYIAKESGAMRPLAIPVLEDKIVQKAVVVILSRIYEQDFLPCSYGYRPGRNAHQAVEAIQKTITLGEVSCVIEADIEDYFGSIVREQLMGMLKKRITDKDVLRLIGKWLHVGVVDEGRLLINKKGTHQGSVISPLLANIYLHEVVDCWVEQQVKPRMQGEVTLVRYADDFVLCFQYRVDAERAYKVLPKRFERYGLKLNMKKTRLINFGRSEFWKRKQEGKKPDTFNFLGFTFYCSTSRDGRFTVKSKTMCKRLSQRLKRVKVWCRMNRHQPLIEQWQYLVRMLKGHYAYYGLRTNYQSLWQFYQGTIRLWWKWLGRRSQRGAISVDKYMMLLKRYPLPHPRITQNKSLQLMLFPKIA